MSQRDVADAKGTRTVGGVNHPGSDSRRDGAARREHGGIEPARKSLPRTSSKKGTIAERKEWVSGMAPGLVGLGGCSTCGDWRWREEC